MKLADTRAERDLQDSLAEIFSIIVTLDELEKAFLKDAVPEADYTEICERSLKQYNALLADEAVMKVFVGLEEFKAEWDVRHSIHATPPPLPISLLPYTFSFIHEGIERERKKGIEIKEISFIDSIYT